MATVWEKIYHRIFWKHGQVDESTPISAANMNVMDLAIDMLDTRVVQLGIDKADADKTGMLYIRYSEQADGSNFTELPTANTKYMGVCVSNSTIAPTEKEKYVWSKIEGPQGPQGPQGPKGESTGNMDKDDYDADESVKHAGGIKAYVDTVLGAVESALAEL